MPGMDIFAQDAFSTTSLTATINEVPEGQAVPTQVDALFTDVEGITTTSVAVEKQGDTLALVANTPRGAPGAPVSIDRRAVLNFTAAHLPARGAVLADEVQNVREFGSETALQQILTKVAQKLGKMRRNLQATNTWHRIGAIKGIVLDSDGTSTICNLFTQFGVAQQTQGMALGTSTTKVRGKITTAQNLAEDVIGDSGLIRGWLALCGRGFFANLVDHEVVAEAYKYQMGEMLRAGGNVLGQGFVFGDVTWQKIYGKVGSQLFIGDTDAYLIPIVDGLFISRFAPAPYMETVNTLGLPYYAKQKLMDFDRGVELEALSCPVHLCTKPRAVIKLTST
jgi:hypothetical protein